MHFSALVNAVFACQKLKISLDCLVMDELESEASQQGFELQWQSGDKKSAQVPKFKVDTDSHLLQQAANLTNGLYWRIPRQSDVFPFLVQAGFLSS